MSDTCECIDGHDVDCLTLLQYRFPPSPENRMSRYWDDAKRFCRNAVLQVAVFFVALYCIFLHFDYLKMRARGRLSDRFYVPEWKVLREDKDGHELGSVEQIYDPVEEHRRAAMNALMDRTHGSDGGDNSPLPARISQESFAERRIPTQENATGDSTLPPGVGREAFAMAEKLFEILSNASLSKNTETSSDGQISGSSPSQTQQASTSSTGTSPFSQYSTHPSDQHPEPIATATEIRKTPAPPLTPSRKTRPFKASAHSQGNTIWMATNSYETLTNPPAPVPEDEPGILYIHRNLSNGTLQIWLLGDEKGWSSVQAGAKTRHPVLKDRYLSMRSDGTPSWVTLASWYATKKHMNA